MKLLTIIFCLLTSLAVSGCVPPCNAVRCVSDIGLRFDVPDQNKYSVAIYGDQMVYYSRTKQYRRIATLGPIYEPGGAMALDRYVYLGETDTYFTVENGNPVEFDKERAGVAPYNVDVEFPTSIINYQKQPRPIISRKWYGYPAMILYIFAVPIDIVANVTVVPGWLIMSISP